MMNYQKIYPYSKNLSILYVEDDLDVLEETYDIFEDYFKTIDTATNGEDGLNKYIDYHTKKSNYYDIVITDINMPKLNGIELTKEIYKINKKQAIIIISAYDEKKYLLELINLGIEQFMIKPLDFDKISDVLYNISYKISKTNDNISHIVNITKDLIWNKTTYELFNKQQRVKLSKKEIILLQLLIKNKNKISTVDEIVNTLWNFDEQNASIENLKAILSRFRKKVPELKIENVYALGYRLSI